LRKEVVCRGNNWAKVALHTLFTNELHLVRIHDGLRIEELSHKLVRYTSTIDIGIQIGHVGDTIWVNNPLALSTHPTEVYNVVEVRTKVVLPRIILEDILFVSCDLHVWAHPLRTMDSNQLSLQ
jgi:hypothetical protein